MQRRAKNVNVVLVGDRNCGKSEFLWSFRDYIDGDIGTIGLDFIKYDYKSVRGEKVPVAIWDTAG